jgi:tRNA(Ile)-lysidine synthase
VADFVGRGTIAADLIERFAADLAAIAPNFDGIGFAVSGGPDSLALLLLAKQALSCRIEVATVDHGLRPAAKAEAELVAELCAKLGVPHATLLPDKPIVAGNIQQEARDLRYRLLAQWAKERGLAHVATAHHQGDVAETFLMRAARGAGISGLASMSPRRAIGEGVILVRPLLGWTREALRGIVDQAGIEPALDPSNVDPRFDRPRIRALLAASPDLSPARLADAARHLADAERALNWLADEAKRTRVELRGESVLIDASGLPYDTVRRLSLYALKQLGHADGGLDGVDRFVLQLLSGRSATIAGFRADPGPPWRIRAAPPRKRT